MAAAWNAAAGQCLFSGMKSGLVTAMVVLDLLFVFLNLTVQLVEQGIDGGIEIIAGFLDMHVLARHVHGHFRLLLQFFDGENHIDAGDLVEMADDGVQLVLHVFTQGGGNFDVMTTDLQIHFFSSLYRVLRKLTGGMLSDSRYLATVRRATTIPCWPSISDNWLSDKGFLPSSAAINCLIRARMAVAEQAPPVSVETWLPKKYFSSKMPRGVAMYFWLVTRDTVDSCKPRISAISRSTSGRMATSPCSKNWRWRSTMAWVTRWMVSKRCWTFLISQRASWSCPVRLPLPRRCLARISAYRRVMRSRG